MGRLRGGLDRRRRAELLERFDLDPGKKARTYSKGNRQKSLSSPPWRRTPSCFSWTSPPPASTRSWSRCSSSASGR